MYRKSLDESALRLLYINATAGMRTSRGIRNEIAPPVRRREGERICVYERVCALEKTDLSERCTAE